MAGARRRKAARAARRRARRTVENTLARERAQEAADEEKEERRPRIARHVGQLDYLHTNGALSADQAKAGGRFGRDFQRSATAPGRLVGRYEADVIRRPGKGSPPPDTPSNIAARERFERACDALGPLCGVVIHVAVLDLPVESWCATNGAANGDAIGLLRFGLAVLAAHYAGRTLRGSPGSLNLQPGRAADQRSLCSQARAVAPAS